MKYDALSEIVKMTLVTLGLVFLFVFLMSLFMPGCQKIQANDYHSEFIASPPGFDCFGIFKGSEMIGGNCVKKEN